MMALSSLGGWGTKGDELGRSKMETQDPSPKAKEVATAPSVSQRPLEPCLPLLDSTPTPHPSACLSHLMHSTMSLQTWVTLDGLVTASALRLPSQVMALKSV